MSGYATDINLLLFLLLLPYLYVMMRVYRGLTLISLAEPGHVRLPKLSVVIATNRSPEALEAILRDLAVQNYSHDNFEIIIADDSHGKWEQFIAEAVSLHPAVRVVPNPATGKKSALAAAVATAEGDLIITTDDDCSVGPSWLLSIASFYNRYRPDMIICPVELTGADTLFTKIQQLEFSSLQGVTAGSAALGDPLMCNGAALAFKREAYPLSGKALNESVRSGDDVFFLHYLKKKGAVIEWLESPEATVRTEAAATLFSLFRQRSRWASKSVYYSDVSTIVTGVAVLLASIITGSMLIYSIFNPEFLPHAFALLLLKSVPDILIVMNRLQFQGRTELLAWFPVVQLLYPFYVVIAFVAGLFRRKKW
jgi:cellulose synthase/poly-beta-1,6-N-acetylglucosamine synthase-like glycosyltransferase